jgi:hypothetical protein
MACSAVGLTDKDVLRTRDNNKVSTRNQWKFGKNGTKEDYGAATSIEII